MASHKKSWQEKMANKICISKEECIWIGKDVEKVPTWRTGGACLLARW